MFENEKKVPREFGRELYVKKCCNYRSLVGTRGRAFKLVICMQTCSDLFMIMGHQMNEVSTQN